MKKLFLFATASLFFFSKGFSQSTPGSEGLIHYHTLTSQLTSKSDTLKRKYLQKYEMDLEKGDMLLVKYSSPEYAVSVYMRNSKGDTLGSVPIPRYYNDKGSYLTYLFKPADGGHYNLLLTSKDSLETGKFVAHFAVFNPTKNEFNADAEFCERLDYILQQSATDFWFIAGENSKDFSLTNTRITDYYLWTPSKCLIEHFTNDVYVCTILENINLETCNQKMKEINYEIKQCTNPQWKITEKRREDVSEMNRARFEKELDYQLTGKPDEDHNEVHEKYNLKYSIRQLIEKNLSGNYDLKIIIE